MFFALMLAVQLEEPVIEQVRYNSWSSIKVEAHSINGTKTGVFAKAPIRTGDTVAIFGGTIMNKAAVLALPTEHRPYVLQIDDNAWIGGNRNQLEIVDHINHSCDPNVGIKGNIILVAMRDITVGEEITFDFATVITQWAGMDPITCNYASPQCRKIILADDWQKKELQEKYKGYFSSYIQEKIAALNTQR